MKKSWALYAHEKKINIHQKHIAGKHWALWNRYKGLGLKFEMRSKMH